MENLQKEEGKSRLSELPFSYFRSLENCERPDIFVGEEKSIPRVGRRDLFPASRTSGDFSFFFGTPGAGLRRCIFRRAAGRSRLSPPNPTVIS